jgi:hypothetical protein
MPMRPFRFSIAEMMVVVLIVAMDLSAVRLLGPFSGPWMSQLLELIIVGVLPMANLLAVWLLYGFHQRTAHGKMPPSVLRFEVWGWTALVAWTGCFALFTEPIHSAADRVAKSLISPHSFLTKLAFLAFLVALLLLPPLAVALVGSRLPARYRIRSVIEPPSAPAREQGTRTMTTAHCSSDGSERRAGY